MNLAFNKIYPHFQKKVRSSEARILTSVQARTLQLIRDDTYVNMYSIYVYIWVYI